MADMSDVFWWLAFAAVWLIFAGTVTSWAEKKALERREKTTRKHLRLLEEIDAEKEE